MSSGAFGVTAKHSPFRIKPDGGQRSENAAHPSIKQLCDVLNDDEPGSNFPNETGVLKPESGAVPIEAFALYVRDRNVLARTAAADDVNSNSVCRQALSGEFSNVFINRNLRPMLCQDTPAERIDFTHRGDLEACTLQTEFKAANPAEESEDLHFIFPLLQ